MKKAVMILVLLFAAQCGEARHYSFRGGYPAGTTTRQQGADAGVEKSLKGKVTWVSDGDTIWLTTADGERHEIRLYGIDAPEKGQPWGEESKQALTRKVYGRGIVVRYSGRDKYDRIVGRILLGKEDVNGWMLKSGHAWWYRYFAADEVKWAECEKSARRQKKGLWAEADPINPYQWRKAHRASR